MITLDRLVDALGEYGVRLKWSSVPRSTELRSVVIHETTGNRAAVGDVLLAIGADTVTQAVHWAASARAAVVLLRGDGQEVTFDGASEALAIMVVDEKMAGVRWRRSSTGGVEGRETESGRGPTDLFALADSLADAIGGAVVIQLTAVAGAGVFEAAAARRLCAGGDNPGTPVTRTAARIVRGPWSLRPPGGLRQSTVYPRGGRTWHERAHGSGGARDENSSGRCGSHARRRWKAPLSALWPMARTRWPCICCAHQPAWTWNTRLEFDLVIRVTGGSADAATLASRLGLPHSRLRVIALQAFTSAERDAPLPSAFERATTGFGWSRPGRSALAGNTVYTVLPGEQAATARRWVTGLRAALPEGVTVLAGISGVAEVADLAAARHEADECLALHETTSGPTPPAYDELWTKSCCSGCAPLRGQVGPQTVDRWPSCVATTAPTRPTTWRHCGPGGKAQGDPVEAGRRLGVHENTVRNRLRKMAEITELPLDDARKRLAMMIDLAVTDND